MILQDPKYSLNPVMRVGRQIEECLRDHQGLRGRAARTRVHELLSAVRIRDPGASPPPGRMNCPAAWASG